MGLLTDSGNFSHDDVTEETFLTAAKLMKAGADIRALNYNLFKKQPKTRAELYAYTMSRIRYFLEEKLAVISISLETMKQFGADNGMTEGFVDFPLSVDTVEVSASVMEVRKGQYKISLRSKIYADVNKIAGTFGGGGHVRAAGCMLFGSWKTSSTDSRTPFLNIFEFSARLSIDDEPGLFYVGNRTP